MGGKGSSETPNKKIESYLKKTKLSTNNTKYIEVCGRCSSVHMGRQRTKDVNAQYLVLALGASFVFRAHVFAQKNRYKMKISKNIKKQSQPIQNNGNENQEYILYIS